MTVQSPESNNVLFKSRAEAISPGVEGDYVDNPPAADGSKVIISDTDHLWGVGGDQKWVWKSFLRGINPIFMDPYDTSFPALGKAFDSRWEPARRNMGYTLKYSQRINLTAMVPRGDLASSGYCLADPGEEYLVYLPAGSVTLDLSGASRDFSLEWFNPATGETVFGGGTTQGGSRTHFRAPFQGDAVLFLKATSSRR